MIQSTQLDFTVFTCTYNRAHTLVRTYESLCAQTHKNFEWIIFDNGSTDNTGELVEQWITEGNLNIRHMGWRENTGVQRTFNEGVKAAKGRFYCNVDSDDTIVPHAFEKFIEIWNTIPEKDRHRFAGVTVNCVDQHGNLVGTGFPNDPTDTNTLEMYYKLGVKGEKFGFTRMDVMREYPFPDSEHHVSPGIVWRDIARKYQLRCVNESLRVYYIDEVGRADQLTQHFSIQTTAFSRLTNHKFGLNNEMNYFIYAPVQFCKMAAMYAWSAIAMNIKFSEALSDIKPVFAKILVIAAYPFAYATNTLAKYFGQKADQA